MRLELRDLYSPDVDDLAGWTPHGEAFALLLTLIVGEVGAPGEERFSLTVCSPAWIAEAAEHDGVWSGHWHLVVAPYDFARIESYCRQRVHAIDASDWESAVASVEQFAGSDDAP